MYIQGLVMNVVNNKIALRLQSELFGKIVMKDMIFFKKNSGAKITAFFSDIGGITEIINIFLNTLFLQFFTLLFLVGLMFYNNWKLSIISFIAFPVLILPFKQLSKLLRKLIKKNKNENLSLYSSMS